MNPVLQLEEDVPIQVPAAQDEPKLLVEWTSRWQEFRESIKPALARSEARLAGEAPFGLIPLRIMVPSYVVEAFLILFAIFLQIKVQELRPHVVPRISTHDVIYYSGDELPRTEDLGGAEAGRTGRAGGDEAAHRTQTIKIARGGSRVEKVIDAPNVKLPPSQIAVANLLAIRPNPGPPPTEGMRATRSVPNLGATIVAPSPNVIHDYTRNGVQLNAVIAPAPAVVRDRPQMSPTLSTELIPPAPNVSSDHVLVAPRLAPTVVPPSPRVPRDPFAPAPTLNGGIVAPAPAVPEDRTRSGPALASQIIPPAPGALSRELSSTPVQMTNPTVVPPPVSAPERASSRNAKVTLPTPSVVAPPPSADLSSDVRRLAGGSAVDPGKSVVPPPPSASGSGSLVSSLIGKIFGASEVVPPPPAVNTASTTTSSHSLASNVVPPPPSAAGTRGARNGLGESLGSNVVAPPPSVGVSGGTGNRSHVSAAQSLGAPNVVPPPPTVSGVGGGNGNSAGGAGVASGSLLAKNVVPPPPAVGGGTNAGGSGLSRKGVGLGAPLNVGSPTAQPVNGGSGENAGAVISSQPGSKVGLPPTHEIGSLAMSPAGGNKLGTGGAEGGTGIGRGNGAGSGMSGTGSGAAKNDTGHGSETAARGGISPANGPGGAGNIAAGNPAVPGVDISGGSSIITLPSFGSDPSGSDLTTAARSPSAKRSQILGVTVVATAKSGGAFAPYRSLLRGDTYTTYLDTSHGTVVMEFSDESARSHAFGGALTAPAAIRDDLPEGLPHARMVVACRLDSAGNLSNVRVLEAGPATMTAKVMAALRAWKFQPAMRGDQPVEVTAILGFGIDTNDRF